MKDLVDTTEMYLRTIYDLEEEGVVPLRARIAERLEQSGPTVSQTVARMERDGLLMVAGDRHLELTDKGRDLDEVMQAIGDWSYRWLTAEQPAGAGGLTGEPDCAPGNADLDPANCPVDDPVAPGSPRLVEPF